LKYKTLILDTRKLENENLNEPQNPALNIGAVSGSSIEIVEERCKSVLEYLFPNYEREMTARQYNNAMEALRSIAFGTPKGKNYR
jgi:hypothetical protein